MSLNQAAFFTNTDQPFGKISQTLSSDTRLLMSLSMLSATPGYYNINMDICTQIYSRTQRQHH